MSRTGDSPELIRLWRQELEGKIRAESTPKFIDALKNGSNEITMHMKRRRDLAVPRQAN
jgi:hypothetical protein